MARITRETGLDALYGGWFLGGGGGGSLEGGIATLDSALALGGFDICDIAQLSPEAHVLTGSLVGSPSKAKSIITGRHCNRAYELYSLNTGASPAAVVSNEAGAQSISNGWITAAANNIPVVDAACNGRAHPTGVMGAMGLDTVPGYVSAQSAVGGEGENYVELFTQGSIESTSKLVREASVRVGGFVTVLRNPVKAEYIKANAALGALSMCMETGRAIRANEGDIEGVVSALSRLLDMRVLSRGCVDNFTLCSKGGFDVGSFTVLDTEVTFWNEFMTAEKNGAREATFPDLIAVLSNETGLPVCSAGILKGLDVTVVCVPRERLLLGRAMYLEHLFKPCEEAVQKPVIPHIFNKQ